MNEEELKAIEVRIADWTEQCGALTVLAYEYPASAELILRDLADLIAEVKRVWEICDNLGRLLLMDVEEK